MIKNKDKLIQEKTDKLALRLRDYVYEMDELSGTDEFSIDEIEKRWGDLENYTKQIYREINDEIISQLSEKGIIKSKKGNTRPKG